MSRVTLYTVGHGDRSLDELLALLREAGIGCVMDVRAHPHSKRNPQFEQESLQQALEGAGIEYVWEGRDLGGMRKGRRDSRHVGLKEKSDRAYADHMESDDFRRGAAWVIHHAEQGPTAVLCAETLPTQCHRKLIADYLTANGLEVVHLIHPGERRPHELHPYARKEGRRVIYDKFTQQALGLFD